MRHVDTWVLRDEVHEAERARLRLARPEAAEEGRMRGLAEDEVGLWLSQLDFQHKETPEKVVSTLFFAVNHRFYLARPF